MKAIQIEQKRSAIFAMVTFGTLVIDMPEVDGVIKSLTFYQAAVKEKKPKNEPYYAYITNNDVIIACAFTERVGYDGWNVVLSQRYHYLKSTIPNTLVSIRNKDIDDLADMIKKAKEKSGDL